MEPCSQGLALNEGSLSNPVAQHLSKLPDVAVLEQNWVETAADWLREHKVARAFIASHNAPNQFAEESTFYLAALGAGVQYVVGISTTDANVRPDCDAYYPRTHWAIEAMLARLSSETSSGLRFSLTSLATSTSPPRQR